MSTYLIIGGNSQIATHFYKKYKNEPEDLYIMVDKNCYTAKKSSKLHYFNADLTKKEDLKNLEMYLKQNNIIIDYVLFTIGINLENCFFHLLTKSLQKL